MLDEAFHQINSIKYIKPFAKSTVPMYFCLYIPALPRLQRHLQCPLDSLQQSVIHIMSSGVQKESITSL